MSAQFTTMIEQTGILNGEWQNPPHNQTAVREPKSAGNSKGHLFVVAEVQGDIANLPMVEKRLAALVRDTYYPTNGGVTAGLRRAIQAANQWLHQHNTTSESHKTVIAGIVVVALREEDLFVAQVGPAALFVCLNSIVRRYPEASTWLDPLRSPTNEYAPALGLHSFVEPTITHLYAQSGDRLLLTDGRLGKKLSLSRVTPILTNKTFTGISQSLIESTQVQQGSALLLEITPEHVSIKPSPETALSPAEAIPELAGKFHFALPNILPRQKDTPNRQKSSSPTLRRFENDTDNSPAEFDAVSNAATPLDLAGIWQTILTGLIGMVGVLGSGLRTILKLVMPGMQNSASPRQAGAQVRPTDKKSISSSSLMYIVIGLPLVILLIAGLMYWYKGYKQDTAYTAALQLAQEKYRQAQTALPDQSRTLLTEADQQLKIAATIKPAQKEITELQTGIQDRRDQINEVQRLYYVPELKRYTDPGTRLKQVIVQGSILYVMDGGLNRVFYHTLDDIGDALLPDSASPVVAQQGQSVEGSSIGNIIDMVWMPAGGGRQTSDLLILQQNGLLEFDPDWGTTPISIYGAGEWRAPIAIGSYFGNFYLLDAGVNQIYRYLPATDGYSSPPEAYFSPEVKVDLSGAVDMAIDGAVYVLFGNGQIKKFVSGQPAPFEITGLDIPLSQPAAIYTAPDELAQSLYIADTGNQRVVQLTKEGQFIRQLKPRQTDGLAFDGLQSVFVDEISQKMFVLNNNSLYAPNLPTDQTNQQQQLPQTTPSVLPTN